MSASVAGTGKLVDGETVVRLTVNGQERRGIAEPRTLLVDFLRQELGLTGTHVGCEQGVCGSCTIRVDGELVRACTVFAVQAEGAQLETVEGLAGGDELHPVQQAFQDEHGLQCGFCTPGLLLATVDLLERNSSPSEDEIRDELAGSVCRCTGYVGIVAAVQAAARAMQGGS
jgi:carbon-monoxide dehydrogenase small subunit